MDHGIERICPIYEYHPRGSWDSFTARGRLAIAQALLEGSIDITSDLIEIVYACTLCGACHEICVIHFPVVMGVSKIDELDQVKVFEALRAEIFKRKPDLLLEPHKQITYRIRAHHNPYGEPHDKRFAWLDIDIYLPSRGEIVYFVGCTSPYRNSEICKSTIKILSKAGVTPAIIDEWCCGSILLRTGQWDYVNDLVKHNLEELKKAGAKKIVTTCAGCYRTLKLDYPELLEGKWDFEVLHVTELLKDLIDNGKLVFQGKFEGKVTYHDPCHLGRHAGVFDAPRDVIRSIPGIEFIEMKPTRQYAMCCGGGGGLKSVFNEIAVKIGVNIVKKAKDIGVKALLSACPFCKRNLTDAIRKSSIDLELYDITELIAKVI